MQTQSEPHRHRANPRIRSEKQTEKEPQKKAAGIPPADIIIILTHNYQTQIINLDYFNINRQNNQYPAALSLGKH
jgi:hypothetical protein